jgi:hypothetical protein
MDVDEAPLMDNVYVYEETSDMDSHGHCLFGRRRVEQNRSATEMMLDSQPVVLMIQTLLRLYMLYTGNLLI